MKTTSFFLLFSATVLLAACGFHLRGHGNQAVNLAFQSVYLRVANETPFVSDLRNALNFNKVAVTDSADQATITLEVVSEATNKQILSLSSAGKVLEYQLRYSVVLRAYDQQAAVWLPSEEILLMRTLTYDDTQVLAKEQEEALLYTDMRGDAVMQALRRLSRAKPLNEKGEPINPASGVSAVSGVNEASGTNSAK
jgi:LPS-assembly lipoprotein